MSTSSTTDVADPSDAPVPGAGVIEEPTTTEETKTDTSDVENLDTSKSTDTPAADDDKSTEQEKTDDTPAKTFDEDLDSWAEKTGRPVPTTDAERQAYQDLRDSQRQYSREQEAKKNADEFRKKVDESKVNDPDLEEDEDEDPTEKRLRELEEDRNQERDTRLQSEFYTEQKVTEEQGKTIAEIFDEKMKRETDPKEQYAAFKYWSSPKRLPDLLELAKARLANAETDAAVEAAQKEERERIARESEANSTTRNAKSTVTGDKSDDERRLDSFSSWD